MPNTSPVVFEFGDDREVEADRPRPPCKLANLFVGAVSCLAEAKCAPSRRQRARHGKQRLHGFGVVRKIDQYAIAADRKKIAAAGVRVLRHRAQPVTDLVGRQTEAFSQRRSAQRIRNVVHGSCAQRDRNLFCRANGLSFFALAADQVAVCVAKRRSAARKMFSDYRILHVATEPDDRAAEFF